MYRHLNMILIMTAFLTAAAFPAQGKQSLVLLMGAAGSHQTVGAVSKVLENPALSEHVNLYFYTDEDLEQGRIDREIVKGSGLILLDDMYKTLSDYVLETANFKKAKVFGLSTAAREPEKIISDPKVKAYTRPLTRKNLENLICFLLKREYGLNIAFAPPQGIPEAGIFHPESDRIFESFEAYLTWYREKGLYRDKGFWVGIPEMNAYVYPGETGHVAAALIKKLEAEGINVLPVYSAVADTAAKLYFYDEKAQKSKVDLIAALSFKFGAADAEKTRSLFAELGAPVLNPLRVHFLTLPEWEKDPQGLEPMEITYAMGNPEVLGLIEPSVLGGKTAARDEGTGKTVYTYEPIEKNMDFFVRRITAWQKLRSTPNKDKKIAIMFWNHGPGKQNIGATYLNLFRSLEDILARLSKEGYHVEGKLPSEEEIKDLILASGRNIGSWAPGELDALIAKGRAVRLPLDRYEEWARDLDTVYRRAVEAEWGKPEEGKVMTRNREIILPCVPLGNIVLVPQPSRGWHDDPNKLYHSTKLMPHHQYTAFYLWLKHGFKADALISLGTHGTHEWLPGKQTGLSQSCSPEVLIQDIPNIYPYIMDNIGEGVQAKRRGRGVIIDYLIPPVKKAGTYEEYGELGSLINEYADSLGRSPELAEKKYKRIETLTLKLGLLEDLMIKEFNSDAIEAVEHYLLELKQAKLPYGLHTFGRSPDGETLEEFSQLIHERNPAVPLAEIKTKLSLCNRETDHLMDGLSGRYIPSAKGNDPLRNIEAIPTGNNFYGFDPARVPSREAWELGKSQAEQMIEKYQKEKKKYPDKIGLVFWSIELQRNEGTQVGTALHLLGMKPVWDQNGKVTGVEPIPGELLGRPRIDVHLQVSGLFRDNFPNLILLMDDAVQKAGQLKDVENFIAVHNRKIKDYLLSKGYGEKEADQLKQLRVFSNEPGSYGNTIEDLIPNSGLWEGDDEIADVFINFVSFAYGRDVWGKPLKSAYKKNLEDVKITMHTRSSNLFMNLDTDGVFSELGGLALAVKRAGGAYPDVVLSNQSNPDEAHVEDIEKALGRELRSRYLNPKWIEGMKQENYAGAREMNRFSEHLWGWQVTTPFAVSGAQWEQIYEVYIKDKYNMELKAFFDKHNPWARQSMAARMLEADRKGYWKAPEEIKKDLARSYALDVMEKGVACCEHTCNNPMLQKFVTNIISLYGLLTPRELEQFKMTLAKAVGKTQEEHEADHSAVRQGLKDPMEKNREEEAVNTETKDKSVKGFEMVEEKAEETIITSSGSSWMVMVMALAVMGLVALGWKRKKL